ncbi:helix-turn-helix domain-containing protein [Tessaracoccus caeni]|uniref:helix-turn-helix domain-containing protein n=1 Tax=Tessaracoccus caeni TaxID=3031239 RepID=UPI0023DA80B2|nr:helix-turn-helix transcriptional regulator [Tessaracoccus caeni]MDF1488472.1 helix-turn-helix transcriptional regulator [Tessaracoccus caeni]
MTSNANALALGSFLRARRQEVTPEMAGLSEGYGLRRVPGLRREEVARLACISTDFYTRLEQGRRPASERVLDSIADALQLSEDERSYIFALAGKEQDLPRTRQRSLEIRPVLKYLLDELTGTPAMVVGPSLNLLAWNPMASAILGDIESQLPKRQNYLWALFTDPRMRLLYKNWEHVAEMAVAHLRVEAGRRPNDPEIAELVSDLSAQDEFFTTLWSSHPIAYRAEGKKKIRHPLVGEFEVTWEALSAVADPDQQLLIWTAAPGSSSADALERLAQWVASQNQK